MSRLSEWILLNIEALLQPWEDNAEELLPDKSATKAERRDHAKAMLVSICQELEQAQTGPRSDGQERRKLGLPTPPIL